MVFINKINYLRGINFLALFTAMYKYLMFTYKAQVKVSNLVATTLIYAQNINAARLLLQRLYGASNVISVLQEK